MYTANKVPTYTPANFFQTYSFVEQTQQTLTNFNFETIKENNLIRMVV